MLREYGNPVCLFGEGPGERRERLRELIAALGDAGRTTKKRTQGEDAGPAEDEVQEVWYHEGPPELKEARMEIAKLSFTAARDRLKRARLRLTRPDPAENTERQRLHTVLRNFGNFSSQVSDTPHIRVALATNHEWWSERCLPSVRLLLMSTTTMIAP